MELRFANDDLSGEILLYAMKGFYLLKIPAIAQGGDTYHTALIGKKEVALVGNKLILWVEINKQVANILKHQTALSAYAKQPFLGVLINKEIEGITVDEVNFTTYLPINDLPTFTTQEQRDDIEQRNKEKACV